MRDKWIRVEVMDENGDALIRVVDSGEGISEKILSQAMPPFFATKRDIRLPARIKLFRITSGFYPEPAFTTRVENSKPGPASKRRDSNAELNWR
jgi:hypothetical protein